MIVEYVQRMTDIELAEAFRDLARHACRDFDERRGKLQAHWELTPQDAQRLQAARHERRGDLLLPELSQLEPSLYGFPAFPVFGLKIRRSQLVVEWGKHHMTTVYPGPEMERINHGPDGPEDM